MRFILLGFSEWIRLSVHPKLIYEKYHRPYRPTFLGKAGSSFSKSIFCSTANFARNRE